MDEQQLAARNTIMDTLRQVAELPDDERAEFWNSLDDQLGPERAQAIRDLEDERQILLGISNVFGSIAAESGEPITAIAFVDEENPDNSYEVDLTTGQASPHET